MRAVENIKVPHDFHIFKRRGRGWSAKVTLKNGKEGILLRKPKNDASLLFIDFDEIAKGPQVLETWMVPGNFLLLVLQALHIRSKYCSDSFKMYDDSVKKTSMKVELTQSSSYTNNEQKFGAKFGMDGKIVGSLANGAGGVTHTNKNQRYPWFQARFFHPVVVSKVVFYNRVSLIQLKLAQTMNMDHQCWCHLHAPNRLNQMAIDSGTLASMSGMMRLNLRS